MSFSSNIAEITVISNTGQAQGVYAPPVVQRGAPPTTGRKYGAGQVFVDTLTRAAYINVSSGEVDFQPIGGGSTALDSLDGDSGSATPSSGAITLAGTASQIVTSASGSTVTFAFATPNVTMSTTALNLIADAPATSTLITSSNTDNTNANSGAGFNSLVGGPNAGDAYNFYEITGGQAWIHGIDNSDSDAFVLSASTALGTSNVIRFSTSGDISVPLGDFSTSRAEAGGVVLETLQNTDNTNGASNARLDITTGGASSGDPYIHVSAPGTQDWSFGMDNSDGDSFKISRSTGLGTNDCLVINTTEDVRISNGDLQITNGNLFLETAGNKLGIATGANASIGTATFPTAASVTVNTTAITANSFVFVQLNTSVAAGQYAVPTASIVPGVSFTITSTSATDASTVNWWIVN